MGVCGRNNLLQRQSKAVLLILSNKGYINLGEWVRVWGMSVHHWLVLGMLHLHAEECQVLAGHVLIGRKKVKPVIWPPDYKTASRGGRHGAS